MSRLIEEIQIFVSYPEAFSNEKDCVEEICEEISKTIGFRYNVTVEPINWKKDFEPGIDPNKISAQEVINAQIERYDYDLYVGLFWSKIKDSIKNDSANNKKKPGINTIKELKKAIEEYSSKGYPNIRVYLKENDSSDSEDSEMKKICDKESCLYWKYKDLCEFERSFRKHLVGYILDWIKKKKVKYKNFTLEKPLDDKYDCRRILIDEGKLNSIRFKVSSFYPYWRAGIRFLQTNHIKIETPQRYEFHVGGNPNGSSNFTFYETGNNDPSNPNIRIPMSKSKNGWFKFKLEIDKNNIVNCWVNEVHCVENQLVDFNYLENIYLLAWTDKSKEHPTGHPFKVDFKDIFYTTT